MTKKAPEGLLDIIANYKHLANPFYSITHTPSNDSHAPGGKWALSDNKAVNLGIWNALGVASWALPTAALASYFTNKWWDRKMRKASKSARLSRLTAVTPRLTPDQDLSYIANVVEDPNREAELVDRLLKKSNDPEDKSISGSLKNWFSGVAAASLPIAAVPLSMLAAKIAVDKLYSKSMEDDLADERVKIRNLQNAIDYRTMVAQGLVKRPTQYLIPGAMSKKSSEDSNNYKRYMSKEDAIAEIDRRDSRNRDKRGILNHYFSWPVLTAILGGGSLAMLAFNYLRNHDTDAKVLDFVRKKSLGHNVMQTTPEIGLEQFGIPTDQIIARPGDKKEPVYIDANGEDAPKTELEKRLLGYSNNDPDLKSELEELVVKGSGKDNKADALFG